MRVTNGMIASSFLRDLYTNNEKLNKYQNQLNSGKRILRPSDDPIATAKAVKTHQEIDSVEQYQKNAKTANEMLRQSETAVYEITNIMQRLEELIGIGASDVYTHEQKASTALEIAQLRDELVSLGNTTYSGEYLFGGYNTTKPPFEVDASGNIKYNGIDMISGDLSAEADVERQFKVDKATYFSATINGVRLFGTGEDNVYKLFDDVVKVMSDPDKSAEDVAPYMKKLNGIFKKNLAVLAEVGSRQSRLELMDSRFEDNKIDLAQKESDLEDIDEAETITYYKYAFKSYQMALQVGAQIVPRSILDYL